MGWVNLGELKKTHAAFLKANERMIADAAEFAKDEAIKSYDKRLGFTPYYTGKLSKIVKLKGGRIARIVDKGTRPHMIRPRKKGGMLVFRGRNGRMVFARSVRHPGSGPFRFGPRVASHAYRLMARFIEPEAAKIVRRFSS